MTSRVTATPTGSRYTFTRLHPDDVDQPSLDAEAQEMARELDTLRALLESSSPPPGP